MAGDMLAAAMPPNAGAAGVMKPPMAPAPEAAAPKAPDDGTVTVPKSSIPTDVKEGDTLEFSVVSMDGENIVLTYATPEEKPEDKAGEGSDKMPKGGLEKAFSEAEQAVGKDK
jgi:hypothetical protein